MLKQYNVAVVGATGVVGREFLKIAEQRRFPVKSLKLLATERSKGKRIPFGETEIAVEVSSREAVKGADFIFISATDEASREYGEYARELGAIAIDDSGVWRQDPSVPLVVPEINPDDVKDHAPAALRHRLSLHPDAELEGVTTDEVIESLLKEVPVPRSAA